jgi:hypothetical protein
MATETRSLPCGAIVERYGIIGTTATVYRAYRPSSVAGAHSSITTIGGAWYGDVATERPPADVDSLPPRSTERFAAVSNWYAAKHEEAYRLIFAAYPEARCPGARGYRQDMGSVETWA